MTSRTQLLQPAVAAIWASLLREVRVVGRYKTHSLFELGWASLFFLPLLLTSRAFGSEGFEASGSGTSFAGYAGVGLLSMHVATSVLYSGFLFLSEGNQTGVLPHVWTTSVARWIPLLAATLFDLSQSALRAVLALAMLFVVLGADAPSVNPAGVVALALGALIFWGSGMAYAGIGLWARSGLIATMINGSLFLMAGAAFPITISPWSIRWISYAIPHTYVIDAIRGAMLGTPTLVPLAAEFVLIAVLAFVAVAGGIAAFAAMDRRAIRKGVIGLYT